jgi:hypothetical protein
MEPDGAKITERSLGVALAGALGLCLSAGAEMLRRAPAFSRSSAPSRLFAALVASAAAWLVVLCQLTTALHFALISHHFCAVHGELVHGAAVERQPARADAGAEATPGGTKESDEHCPLLSRKLEHAALVAIPNHRLPPAPIERTVAVATSDGVVASRSELLLAAPKQSPPV